MNDEQRKCLAWIAVDWGSSNLRAWALDAHDRVLAQGDSDRGMLALAPAQFEGALLDTIGDWLPGDGRRTQVLVCGMAGARQGWVEAAYLPLRPDEDVLGRLGSRLTPVPVADPRLAVGIVPGLSQSPAGDDASGFDVMRGEETQLAGLVATLSGFSGAVCLPGTHAKWAELEDGRIRRFSTYMSGELYKLLSRDSVLAHSLAGDDAGTDPLEDEDCRAAFLAGIDTAIASPGRLSAELFGIRARDLLDAALPPATGGRRGRRLASRLSGLVLGLELAGATAGLAPARSIELIGDAALCRRYRLALEHLGFAVHAHANADMILAGLSRVHRHSSKAS